MSGRPDVERVTGSPIDVERVTAVVRRDEAGAVLTFAGVVRSRNQGRSVVGIDYHGYRPMAAREIERLEGEIESRWPDVRSCIVHRLGELELGQTSVFIAVSSPHRDEGFRALRFAIDTLKERLPIWKREIYTDGAAWLEGS